jgi:ATP-dependent Clp protease ATP-binding subunit ClpB
VLLFDEIEKAHPDVFNLLLQVLDDGRITDSQGRVVDFKNTVIIMTSNLGSDIILDGISEGEINPEAREAVDMLLKRSFRPEFLNRLDEIIYFKPLMREDVKKILSLATKSLSERLSENRISVSFTERAEDYIIDSAYDKAFGARPIKRFISSKVETLIARKIISGEIAPDTALEIDFDGESLLVK